MSNPQPTDPFGPIYEMLTRLNERMEHLATKAELSDRLLETERSFNGTLWKAVAVIGTLLAIATGIILKFG